MNWKYKKFGYGFAWYYERAGWIVWEDRSNWKITKPNGKTYNREFKTAAAAIRFAEKNLIPDIDTLGE